MDSLNFKKLQFEKANAIYKYRQLRRMANFFRFFEVCVVVFLISWLSISIQFPGSVKNPSEYFRGVPDFVGSPRFVFLVGNAIIITLFVKSGQLGSQPGTSKGPSSNLYEEFIQNSVINHKTHHEYTKFYEKQNSKAEFCGKRSVKTEEFVRRLEVKPYRRSHSQVENFSEENSEKSVRILRRSETEKCMKKTQCPCGENSGKFSYPEDDLSNEDFRRTVEAFIARQQRSLREDDYAIE